MRLFSNLLNLSILLAIFIEPHCVAADTAPLPKEFVDYFGEAEPEDLTVSDTAWGKLVTRVMPKSPAAVAGLRKGDVILALEGLRICDNVEYGLVRFLVNRYSDSLHLLVWRKGKVVPITITDTNGFRAAGFVNEDTAPLFVDILKEMGIAVPELPSDRIFRMSPRVVRALKDWHSQQDPKPMRPEWLDQFVQIHLQLSERDYAAVRPPTAVSPIPIFQRLTAFYLSLAERHRNGEQPPDPAAHKESTLFFVANYPIPRPIFPSLGKVAFTDKAFDRMLRKGFVEEYGRTEPVRESARCPIDC